MTEPVPSCSESADDVTVLALDLSPAAAPCPKCGRRGNTQWQWKPDAAPSRERLRCYRCGWDTDWIEYGTLRVVRGPGNPRLTPAAAHQ